VLKTIVIIDFISIMLINVLFIRV